MASSPLGAQLVTKTVATASAATLTLLGAVLANNRYGFSYDLGQILQQKEFRQRVESRIRSLGDDTSLYQMLRQAKPDADALWFEGRQWTYGELVLESDKIATLLEQHGVVNGQHVAVFATNTPEMVLAIVALTKLGAVPALINAALRDETLAHCLRIANSSLLLCTPDLAPAIAQLASRSDSPAPKTLCLSLTSFPPLRLDEDKCKDCNLVLIRHEDLNSLGDVSSTRARRNVTNVGVLIYTSGTSGKPKAVAVKNFLLVLVSTPLPIDTRDARRYIPLRTFTCLPLFHATALFTGLYYSAGMSSMLCLARKFSSTRFFTQLTESRATRMLYVGELCRYLLAAPESPADRTHRCIVATGNGLQRDVWLRFKKRFNIPEIREVYRSTEGAAKYDNFTKGDNGAGKVGFVGPIKAYAERDTYLVRYDPTTEAPYRDPTTGFCVLAKPGEPGEAIGRIRTMDIHNEYLNNAEANNFKIIRNVFKKEDMFDRSGDLLVRERSGWIRFHDRSGDTYRWRGENVSAGEVQEHFGKLQNVHSASVFAVKLPAYDGQAGAAAVTLVDATPEAALDFIQLLYGRLRSGGLTVYQVPRLLRICEALRQRQHLNSRKVL